MSEFLKRCKPPFAEQHVTHFKQKYNWDCGLTCILMILPEEKRQSFMLNLEQICKAEQIDRSTWTIDLCYILKRFNIRHSYFTKTFGVHSGYKGEAYYDRILQKDECRINTKFEFAASQGLVIERKSVSASELINHLEFHGPIILLIDANILVCDLCKMNKLNIELRSCLPWNTQYIGHYIVVCGYDEHKRKFLYRNPSFKNRLCVTSYEGLDSARKCFGTDEDTILIFNRKASPNEEDT